MGRITREALLYNGCFAHVFTRAIEKRKIFEKTADFEFFKKKLAEAKRAHRFKVFHYCLMQTHLHMVVSIEDLRGFSEGVKVLKKSYAHHYNAEHARFGPVWRDRYKAKLIENELYLRVCGGYVEQNPVEAGMVGKAVDWPHSSSKHYELGEDDPLVDHYNHDGVTLRQIWDRDEFERMKVIGSDWFQYQMAKQLRG